MNIDQELEDKFISEVPGEDSTSREEKIILADAILSLKPEYIVETGTHRGLTTLYMLEAVRQNEKGHIWTFDPFEWGAAGNFRKFPEHEKFVTYEQKPGKDLTVEKIDFAFIDGYHEKAEVLAELDTILPRLNKDAHVYFHDTNGSNASCDVIGALEERGLEVEYLKTLNGMALYVHKDKRDNTKHKTRRTKNNVRNAKKTEPAEERVGVVTETIDTKPEAGSMLSDEQGTV